MTLHQVIYQRTCCIVFLCLSIFAPIPGKAQTVTGSNVLEKKWLKSGKYEMACYAESGGQLVEMSSFAIEISVQHKTLSVYTALTLSGSNDQWIDTSIADAVTFKPQYRSCYNRNREFVLKYGKEVAGYYLDKKSGKRTSVKETVQTDFVDSYIYPYMLGLLPLKSGYNTSLTVYDYKPENSSNIKKALIEEVKSSRYISSLTGEHNTWQVSVYEEATGDRYDYYIDKETRRIWKVDIHTQNQHLVMVDKESDFNPFKNTFNKDATLQLVKSGSAVISGQTFARDNENEGLLKGMAVLNVNKKQYAPEGTSIVLIPYTDFFKEWIKLNEASRKKGRSIPLPQEALSCIKVASVYDDKGHFEFVNLMPGDYLIFTAFGYNHTSRRTEVTGYTDTYVNGLFQGTSENTVTNSYNVNASASIKKIVTIKEPGEQVVVKLKKTL